MKVDYPLSSLHDTSPRRGWPTPTFLHYFRCFFSYLEADLVGRAPPVAPDRVGRRHRRGVDGDVVGHDQAPTAVVELEPGKLEKFGENRICHSFL